ncbi:MAG: hypothetical protein Q4P24_11620 [Rhodobacterales bacterium]|nr:hypothetical protein [Rhodobacterales bacterium]
MALNHAQFEALFAGLDWRKVKALEARPPAAAEWLGRVECSGDGFDYGV